jgi:cytochrome c
MNSSIKVAVFLVCTAGTATAALERAQATPGTQPAPRSVSDGVYTASQARRGEQFYKSNCSYCHRDDLRGGFEDATNERAPALAGTRAFDSSFAERWGGATMAEFVSTIAATMPQDKPSTLTAPTYVDIAAFLLERNGAPAGTDELPVDVDALNQIVIRAN